MPTTSVSHRAVLRGLRACLSDPVSAAGDFEGELARETYLEALLAAISAGRRAHGTEGLHHQ